MAGVYSLNPLIAKSLSASPQFQLSSRKNSIFPINSTQITPKNLTELPKFSVESSKTKRVLRIHSLGPFGESEPEIEENTSLKKALMDTLNGTERGLKACSETRAEIIDVISQLESKNPNPSPADAPPVLNGKWILAYTSCTALFPLLATGTLPLFNVEEISQIIDSENFTVENLVRFAGVLSTTSVSTNAKFEVRSSKRIQMKLEQGVIGTPQLIDSIVLPINIPESLEFMGRDIDLTPLKGLITSIQETVTSVFRNISSHPPLEFSITSDKAQSWLLTTYLDEELRISRAEDGSVFILIKEGSSLLKPESKVKEEEVESSRTESLNSSLTTV